jgi:hypothetical protein
MRGHRIETRGKRQEKRKERDVQGEGDRHQEVSTGERLEVPK